MTGPRSYPRCTSLFENFGKNRGSEQNLIKLDPLLSTGIFINIMVNQKAGDGDVFCWFLVCMMSCKRLQDDFNKSGTFLKCHDNVSKNNSGQNVLKTS